MDRLMNDPEFLSLMSKPHIVEKMTRIMSLPENSRMNEMMSLINDPEVGPIFKRLSSNMGGLGGGIGSGIGSGIGGGLDQYNSQPQNDTQNIQNSRVVYISSYQQFIEIINQSPIVIADFFADWCGPCKMISSHYQRLSNIYNQFQFIKIDCQKYSYNFPDIKSLPTFKIYKNGKIIEEWTGSDVKRLEDTIGKLETIYGKLKQIPAKKNEIIHYKDIKYEVCQNKILEFNQNVENQLKNPEIEILKSLISKLSSNSNLKNPHYILLKKLLTWPISQQPPVLNLLRILPLKTGNSHWLKDNIMDIIHNIVNLSQDNHINIVLILRLLINSFSNKELHQFLFDNLNIFLELFSICINSKNENLRLSFICLLLNYSILLENEEKYFENKISILSVLLEYISSESKAGIIYRTMVTLGTLLFNDNDIISVAHSFDLPFAVNNAVLRIKSSNYSDINSIIECSNDLQTLFKL